LIIGAYAVVHYTFPRYTKDLDIWISTDRDNVEKVWNALADFGAPLEKLTKQDLQNKKTIYQIGVEPNRIDILCGPGDFDFTSMWNNKIMSSYDGEPMPIIHIDDLIKLKKHANRLQDQVDIENLMKVKNT
jgi:hypothetical protein